MSIKRYQPVAQCVEPSYQAQMIVPKVMEFSEGEYVRWEDYDATCETLAHTETERDASDAEVERLKAEVDALKLGSLLTAVDVLQFIKLKAEVERLTEIIRREVDGGVDLREEAQRSVEENHKLRAEVERLHAVVESHKDAGKRLLAMLDDERRKNQKP